MSDWIVNGVGTLAALCSIFSFVPQILKIWRERDASSVSLRMYALTVTAFVLWTAYGVLLKSWPLIASNSAALLCAGTALALKWKFREGDPR